MLSINFYYRLKYLINKNSNYRVILSFLLDRVKHPFKKSKKKYFRNIHIEYLKTKNITTDFFSINAYYWKKFLKTLPENFKYLEIGSLEGNSALFIINNFKVKKFLFLGSSCIYPRLATQPITEKDLLSGQLEITNEFYAIAKIAGIKLCQALATQKGFNSICLMPTNLYGPGDNYHKSDSHVLPSLIKKFSEAKNKNMKKQDKKLKNRLMSLS